MLSSAGEIFVRIENDGTDLIWGGTSSVERKVAADESSFTLDHVTVRALRFPEEESFPAGWITGELNDIHPALQDSQVADNLIHLLGLQR